ncbi:MAG: hypothetical protein K1X66_06920 [Verrucomicrobiae bacterium]|nr:hypothetical protein [Verrucomicrobiae bacterium]
MSDPLQVVLRELQDLSDSQVEKVAEFIAYLKGLNELVKNEEDEDFLESDWKEGRFDLN